MDLSKKVLSYAFQIIVISAILFAVLIKTDIKMRNWTNQDEYKAWSYLAGVIILLAFQLIKYFDFYSQINSKSISNNAPINNKSDNKLMGNC